MEVQLIDLGVTPDKLTTIQNKIKIAITRADLILTIGGSSVGKYDLVKEAIKSRDARSIIAFRTKLDRGRVTGLGSSKWQTNYNPPWSYSRSH